MIILPYHIAHKTQTQGTHGRTRFAHGHTMRGVVLKTYLPDKATVLTGGRSTTALYSVTCDVLVYEENMRTVLKHVPVMTGSGGMRDHDVWIPEDSSIDVSTGTIVVDATVQMSKVTDLNGDHVLIGFLNNDFTEPMIIGQVPHPRNNRAPMSTDVTQFKSKNYLRGMSFGITQDGNIECDLSSPTSKPSEGGMDPSGNEIPNIMGGNFTMTMQPGALLQLLDSTISNPEATVLGETYITDESTLLNALGVFLAVFNTYALAIKPVADPTNAATPTLTAGVTALTAAINTRISAITSSLSAGIPYLSSHLKID